VENGLKINLEMGYNICYLRIAIEEQKSFNKKEANQLKASG
jgi:hypothetical protein